MVQRIEGVGFENRMKTTPIPVQRTTRNLQHRVLTSLNAGKMHPLAVIPLLREDSVTRGTFRCAFEMSETVEVLMNAINVRVMAYLVPKLAFDRYNGLDSINRSYEGQPMTPGGTVIPWFELQTAPAAGSWPVLKAMGMHFKAGDGINTDYVEAYNQIWNFRARNRSPHITPRLRLDASIAPAFWQHQTFAHIVPDFDQAVIDGEVMLSVQPPAAGSGKTFISGLAASGTPNGPKTGYDGVGAINYTYGYDSKPSTGDDGIILRTASNVSTAKLDVYADIAPVFAQMIEAGVTVSLSNIEMARKTQAFANLRRQYSGHTDEYIIDLLMDGIQIPDESWKQPMLLADVNTVFGMSKRYASDAAALTESVVNGLTYVDLSFSVPRVNTGGIVMIVAEIAPEQLFERQRDYYLYSTKVDDLPQFLRDTLDPEKVQVVKNGEIDSDHTTPNNTFGYAPLNHGWAKSSPKIGGKFHRSNAGASFDEDRQRIWAVETVDPQLTKDFYIVSNMHYKPFVVTDTNVDHFECLVRGQSSIRGNTVFGPALIEANNDYAEVMEEAPQDRITKP